MSGEEYDFTNILEKPIVIVTFVFLVVFYMIYIYVTSTSSSTSSNKDYYNVFESDNDVYSFSDNDSISSGIFAKIIMFLFILVIIVKGYQILFNKTITASIQDLFTNNPKIDIHLNTQPTPTPTTNTPI
jgi:Ni,Fe-hydrogenase I cytochrome b subunit